MLNEKKASKMLFVSFIALALAILLFRWFFISTPGVLYEDTAWEISMEASFDLDTAGSTVNIARPFASRYINVLSQQYSYRGLKILPQRSGAESRDLIAKNYETGKLYFTAQYIVQLSQSPSVDIFTPKKPISNVIREWSLSSESGLNLSNEELIEKNKEILSRVKDEAGLLKNIFDYAEGLLASTDPVHDNLSRIITDNKATTLGRARLMVALCRLNNMPARIVTGFILQKIKSNEPYYWLEVYDEEQFWLSYDPLRKYYSSVPNNYYAFNKRGEYIFFTNEGEILSRNFSIEEDVYELAKLRGEHIKTFIDIFDFERFDIETRNTFALLLLLPIGVLFTAFCRHVLGLNPYGTFTATLLALAAIYTDVPTAVFIAALVIVIALIGRSYLPKKYPREPRLSLIYTFVAMSMILGISIMEYFDLNPSGHIILLPTIIFTSLVDRLYTYMDTDGVNAALMRLAVTVLIAVLCVPILKFEDLGLLLLKYPELHFITAALVLLFASYQGKKLTDYPQFRLLGVGKAKKKMKKKSIKQTASQEGESPEQKAESVSG